MGDGAGIENETQSIGIPTGRHKEAIHGFEFVL